MGKDKIIKVCNIVAFILTLSFVLKLVRDIFVYNSTLNSAPFYVWVIADAVQYLMPAVVVFILGRLIKLKKDREGRDS